MHSNPAMADAPITRYANGLPHRSATPSVELSPKMLMDGVPPTAKGIPPPSSRGFLPSKLVKTLPTTEERRRLRTAASDYSQVDRRARHARRAG
jgi:hypothetical protein